jgi:hypothetical protein
MMWSGIKLDEVFVHEMKRHFFFYRGVMQTEGCRRCSRNLDTQATASAATSPILVQQMPD